MDGRIHHIDITVTDPTHSTNFYDRVLPLLGFRRVPDCDGNPVWAGDYAEVGLQPGMGDPYRRRDRES